MKASVLLLKGLGLCLLLSFTNSTLTVAQSTTAKKWIGTWDVETDHYTGSISFKEDKRREGLDGTVYLRSKKGNTIYRFRTNTDYSKVKNMEIIAGGAGTKNNTQPHAINIQLFRFQTKKEAVGYYLLRSGTGIPNSGTKSVIIIKKR